MLIRSLNMSGFRAASGLEPDKQLRLPSTFQFLPHLLDDPQSLRPAYLVSRGRTGVSVVLGVPTVHREKQSYLIPTLQNLISGMDTTEAEDSLIVVFVGEVRFLITFSKNRFSFYDCVKLILRNSKGDHI